MRRASMLAVPGRGAAACRPARGSLRLQVEGGQLTLIAALHLEGDALAVLQAGEAGALDVGDVGENVRAAFLRLDEAVAFGGVEPFDGTGGHAGIPIMQGCHPANAAGRANLPLRTETRLGTPGHGTGTRQARNMRTGRNRPNRTG